MFDGELEQGGLGNGKPFDSTAYVRSKNFIKATGGKTYTLEESATSDKWKNRYVAQYDANKNHIKEVGFGNSAGGFGKAYSATLDSNCHYVKLKYYAEQAITPNDFHDVCFHLTGTRTGYAPIKTFNLFDEETILALLQYDKTAGDFGQQISGSNITSKNYISVLPNKEYSVSGASPQANMVLFCYDENKNAIVVGDKGYMAIANNGQTFTTPSGCKYVRFYMSSPYGATYNHDICINVSGNKNGTYLPYGVADRLSLPYQGSGVGTAHDTLEITDTEYVFTKNMVDADLGTLDYLVHNSRVFYSYSGFPTPYTNTPNSLSTAYQVWDGSQDGLPNKSITMRGGAGGSIWIRDDSFAYDSTGAGQLKTSLANKTIEYQLATPQVVRIPKKHLAVVDLGKLEWVRYETDGVYRFGTNPPNMKVPTTYEERAKGCMTAKYLASSSVSYATMDDKSWLRVNTGFFIRDDRYVDGATFKQAVSGIYLFYETEAEVDDIPFDINIEAGGSVTANWFSWVENQLVNYSYGRTVTSTGITITNNSDGSFTISGTATAYSDIWLVLDGTQKMYSSHKYLLFSGIDGSDTASSRLGIRSDAHTTSNMDIGYGAIGSPSADTTRVIVLFTCDNGVSLNQTVKPCLIDLTLAFGAGKEPTSVNDPRIQYIIEQGYIPTNTTGTNKSIASEVLPNIDFKIKCK